MQKNETVETLKALAEEARQIVRRRRRHLDCDRSEVRTDVALVAGIKASPEVLFTCDY